jgi:hypothetical protein
VTFILTVASSEAGALTIYPATIFLDATGYYS